MSSIPVEAGFGHEVKLVYPSSGCDSIDLIGKPVITVSDKDVVEITEEAFDKKSGCFKFFVDHNGSVGDVTVTVNITRAEGKIRKLTVWSQVFSMMPQKGENVVRLDISAARLSPIVPMRLEANPELNFKPIKTDGGKITASTDA